MTMFHWFDIIFLIIVLAIVISGTLGTAYVIYRARIIREKLEASRAFGSAENGGAGVPGIDAAAALDASRKEIQQELTESAKHLEEVRRAFDSGIRG